MYALTAPLVPMSTCASVQATTSTINIASATIVTLSDSAASRNFVNVLLFSDFCITVPRLRQSGAIPASA